MTATFLTECVEADRIAADQILAECAHFALRVGQAKTAESAGGNTLVVGDQGITAVVAKAHDGRCVLVTLADETCVFPGLSEREALVAVTDAVVIVIDADRTADLLGLPSVARVLTGALAETATRARDHLSLFGLVSHSDRVRAALVHLARLHGRVTPSGVVLDFPLTHELLAELVGSHGLHPGFVTTCVSQ